MVVVDDVLFDIWLIMLGFYCFGVGEEVVFVFLMSIMIVLVFVVDLFVICWFLCLDFVVNGVFVLWMLDYFGSYYWGDVIVIFDVDL